MIEFFRKNIHLYSFLGPFLHIFPKKFCSLHKIYDLCTPITINKYINKQLQNKWK